MHKLTCSPFKAIRKKLESELSRKRTGSNRIRHTRKMPGTVSALRPSQALTVKENLLVIEAAQLMAAKRSDCVLVVDEEDHLSGIFTVSCNLFFLSSGTKQSNYVFFLFFLRGVGKRLSIQSSGGIIRCSDDSRGRHYDKGTHVRHSRHFSN